MPFRFRKHYTLDEARALLPQVRVWLTSLKRHRRQVMQLDDRLAPLLATGDDLGGDLVNSFVRALAGIQQGLHRFHKLEIQVKDLDRGLLDFPTLLGGREVFLCWEQDEDDIEFWHELETGYAGRERLPES
ncbi:MAG TPA: DUF2203 domain-containing protein [Candidatus Saccharimonadales bacterium]|nr:DUF2203 domain-containing protein [Candidatus Saccharimonadales bacterium]